MSGITLRMAACALLLLLARGAATAQEAAPPPPLKAGTIAPQFTVTTINDRGKVSLHSLRGKVVLVDFWATWCPPCRLSTPVIEALSRRYARQGLVVVSINTDSADTVSEVKPFLKSYHITYPVATLSPGVLRTAGAYHVQYLPSLFLIDRKGVVRWSEAGYNPYDEPAFEARIRKQLTK